MKIACLKKAPKMPMPRYFQPVVQPVFVSFVSAEWPMKEINNPMMIASITPVLKSYVAPFIDPTM